MDKGQVIFFQAEDGKEKLDVRLEQETVWLTQAQMGQLFDKTAPTINEHIKNIFSEEELNESATIRKFRIVRQEGKRMVERELDHYNLDVIISVGYRVKSKRGTQFRIWASGVLKDFLVKGYALNEKRLQEKTQQLEELKGTVKLIGQVLQRKDINTDEARGLLQVISDYAYALDVLDQYDHQQLTIPASNRPEVFKISYESAMNAIEGLKNKFGGSALFGNEKDDSFRGSIGAIYQTFAGEDLYQSLEEKAANLLYFVVKNHSFSDGNKRIAAMLFIWFLDSNKSLYTPSGEKIIEDKTLVALTLMIAESNPDDKDMMIKVIVNLIGQE